VRAANPELFIRPSLKKGKVNTKIFNKDKQKVKNKFNKEIEIGNKGLYFFIPTIRLFFIVYILQRKYDFYWTKWVKWFA
jgi:hypothetical protein